MCFIAIQPSKIAVQWITLSLSSLPVLACSMFGASLSSPKARNPLNSYLDARNHHLLLASLFTDRPHSLEPNVSRNSLVFYCLRTLQLSCAPFFRSLSFVFSSLETLSAKHRGWGVSPSRMPTLGAVASSKMAIANPHSRHLHSEPPSDRNLFFCPAPGTLGPATGQPTCRCTSKRMCLIDLIFSRLETIVPIHSAAGNVHT